MAVPCPCGCGLEVSRFMRKTGERAIFVDSLSAIPRRLAELDLEHAANLQQFAKHGEDLSFIMLHAVHAGGQGLLPSAKEVGDWERDALQLQRTLQKRDPQWSAAWKGPVRNRVAGRWQTLTKA